MTATFGKLEHETLTLEPGLNVLYAPNEWGKSTWCAFLMAMLYGLGTRAKTTKTALAEKDRYAPWSGSPMEGRIDLNWQGRDITIERSTRGRIPMGWFRAYETHTGLEIPELTAVNCGQTLLGVEQSIFRRSGFIRLTDLPVTQDEALQNRLNALVTTGDESGDAIRLAEALKELKNRCRYNRSGLLPQARAREESLLGRIQEIESLSTQIRKLRERQEETNDWLRQLENHRRAMANMASQEDALRVAEARETRDEDVRRMEAMEAACANLPSREEAEQKEKLLGEFVQQWNSLQMESRSLSVPPVPPDPPEAFRGVKPERVVDAVEWDTEQYRRCRSAVWLLWLLAGVLCLTAAGVALWVAHYPLAACALVPGILSFAMGIVTKRRDTREARLLASRYNSDDPSVWRFMADSYRADFRAYEKAMAEYKASRGDAEERLEELNRQRSALCGSLPPEKALEQWRSVIARWDAYANARIEAARAEKYLNMLQAMARPSDTPAVPDALQYSPQETEQLIAEAQAQKQRLLGRIEQQRGRMEALGDAPSLRRQLTETQARIDRLEETYAALTIAQETLAKASAELQRRFAPQIAQRAQLFLGALTEGRYDRLALGEDLSLRAGAAREDTLHDALWRSDGTVDQLYLALRLSVSEALIPDAPLILDDALVRFDDDRMLAALKLLRELAQERQILLFTCQHRERQACEAAG